MKIRTKILGLFTLGAVVPLLVSHFFAVSMASSALRGSIAGSVVDATTLMAGQISQRLERLVIDLENTVLSMPFSKLDRSNLHPALEVPYRQLPEVTIVALLDESGRAVTPPYVKSAQEARALGRESVSQRDLDLFSENVPLRLALSAEAAFGPVYFSSKGKPRIVAAKSFQAREKGKRWVFAVELSLASTCELVSRYEEEGVKSARLFDARGTVFCVEAKDAASTLVDPRTLENLVASRRIGTYTHPSGSAVLAAAAPIGVTNWSLLFEHSEEIALKPVKTSLYWTALWVGVALAIAVVGGFLLARGLTRPIESLEVAAQSISHGKYGALIEVGSRDELGRLAEAFNHMSREIQSWNRELTARVQERTEELREAHEQILKTQKLAAVGELGSGVAHEINNPLTGVIGTAQLLEATVEPGSEVARGLGDIVSGAKRVAEVVDSLLRLSQSQVSAQMHMIDLCEVIPSVLAMFEARFQEHGVVVKTSIDRECRIYAIENDLRLVLNQLIENALRAMAGGGRLLVEAERVDGGAVKLRVRDTGAGMPSEVRQRAFDPFFTTNAPGSGARGLGLPMVQRIVDEHDGRIVLESEVDRGTIVKIYLPGVARLSRA